MIYLTDGFFLFTIRVLSDCRELKTGPCQARVLSGLSRDQFCFITSTGAPELSQADNSHTTWRSLPTAFIAKVRNLRAGKQSPIYAKVINRSFLYIYEHEVTSNVKPVCCNKPKKPREKLSTKSS